jgi:hypothetical protein
MDEIDAQVQRPGMARSFLERLMACRCVEPAECGREIRRLARA